MLNLTKTVYVEPLAEYRAWKVISFQAHSAKPQEKEFNTRTEAVDFASKQENKNVLQPLVIGVH
jgi:hypothetical protein